MIIDLDRTGWNLVQALEKQQTRLESPEGNIATGHWHQSYLADDVQ